MQWSKPHQNFCHSNLKAAASNLVGPFMTLCLFQLISLISKCPIEVPKGLTAGTKTPALLLVPVPAPQLPRKAAEAVRLVQAHCLTA